MRITTAAIGIVLAVGLASGAGASAVQDPATETAGAESKPEKSKKICRTIVKSGTRFGTRHCRSKEDWDRDREHASRYLEEGQTYGSRRNDGITNVP